MRPAGVRAPADPELRYSLAPLSIGSRDVAFGQRLELMQSLPLPERRRLRGATAEADAEVTRAENGTVAFPRWRGGDVEPLVKRLRERHDTAVVPGRFFGLPGHFRIGIGGETATVAGGLERLGAALDELRGSC